jgi:hypothetical protein
LDHLCSRLLLGTVAEAFVGWRGIAIAFIIPRVALDTHADIFGSGHVRAALVSLGELLSNRHGVAV